MAKKTTNPGLIARNPRARFDYSIEQTFEAGCVLQGWELKSIRAGKANLTDTYVTMRDGEAYLVGSRIEPLKSASSHVVAEPNRSRKLLLHARELARIYSGINTRGRTCIALSLYWRGSRVKCEIGLAQGRKKYDKRELLKDRAQRRDQERALKGR